MQSAPTKSHGRVIAFAAMTLSLMAGLACPGNLDPALLSGAGGSGPPCDAPALFEAKCGTSICHDPTSISGGGLDLVSANQAARLVGVTSGGEMGSECGGMVYLNAGSNPATGLLVDKLTYPTCGDQMPYLVSWNDEYTQCVLDWATSVTTATAP
jgi:hypothetical protein